MKKSRPAEVIYDGLWHYKGFLGCRSVCHLKLVRSEEIGESGRDLHRD